MDNLEILKDEHFDWLYHQILFIKPLGEDDVSMGNDNIDIWCTDRLAFTRIFFKGERGIKEINNFIKWMNELISTTAKKDL